MSGILREKKSTSTGILREKSSDKGTKPTRFYSKKQENSVAKAVGGKRTLNSGATMFGGKSDVLTHKFAVECKTKTADSDSISIKKEWIEKLNREALFDGKDHYAVAISFGPNSPNYYIIDEISFKEYLEFLENDE